MKKILICFGFLIFVSGIACAGDGAIPIMQVAISSISTAIISVSTSSNVPGATQMDVPQMANRRVIEIQNIDSTANLWCLSISTVPIVNGGRKIAAGASWIVSVANSVQESLGYGVASAKFWCLSDGAAATKAAVTQLY